MSIKDLPDSLIESVQKKLNEGFESDESLAKELFDYIRNESSIYNQYKSIVKNLAKKIKKGSYDHDLAAKGFSYLVDSGMAAYARDNGSGGSGKDMFSPAVRQMVAKELADEFKDLYDNSPNDLPLNEGFREDLLAKIKSAKSLDELNAITGPIFGTMDAEMLAAAEKKQQSLLNKQPFDADLAAKLAKWDLK